MCDYLAVSGIFGDCFNMKSLYAFPSYKKKVSPKFNLDHNMEMVFSLKWGPANPFKPNCCWKFIDVKSSIFPTGTLVLNKANLRDLIAATGLVILLKLDSNRRIFTRVTLKFDGWPRKLIRHVFYKTSSFVYHFISISEFKLELQSGKAQFGSN